MRWILLPIMLVLSAAAAWDQARTDGFVIDPARPYAFIEFDHVGDRKPLSTAESRRGLWLRIVNNCAASIRVDAFDLGTGDPGKGLFYDILPVKYGAGYVSASGEIHSGNGPKNVPQGYYFSSQTVSHTVIPPGGNLLFSVPSNHVQPEWYVQIRFQLDLPPPGSGRQPISLLEFHWLDIPEKYRESSRP